MDYESHAVALDRNELGALLVAAGLGQPPEHALISLVALNGLRVSEATGADLEHPGLDRGHRTLTITRKGGKVVTIPLAPRTARAVDLAIADRKLRMTAMAARRSWRIVRLFQRQKPMVDAAATNCDLNTNATRRSARRSRFLAGRRCRARTG